MKTAEIDENNQNDIFEKEKISLTDNLEKIETSCRVAQTVKTEKVEIQFCRNVNPCNLISNV